MKVMKQLRKVTDLNDIKLGIRQTTVVVVNE